MKHGRIPRFGKNCVRNWKRSRHPPPVDKDNDNTEEKSLTIRSVEFLQRIYNTYVFCANTPPVSEKNRSGDDSDDSKDKDDGDDNTSDGDNGFYKVPWWMHLFVYYTQQKNPRKTNFIRFPYVQVRPVHFVRI